LALVHPTAIVDPRAKLADTAQVGPYCTVGPDVELDEDVVVQSHAVVTGHTSIGARTRIFPFACVGGEPQDKKFEGEPTRLSVGRDNVIRENVTIHVGTRKGGGQTRLGDDNLIMNGAHVAHDCQIGSHTIIASFCGIAGHVHVDDFAVLGAFTGVHQFTRVGESVMTAANTMLSQDAPPFSMVAGDRARLVGLNIVGVRRRGYEDDTVRKLKHAFHVLFQSKLRLEPACARVRAELGDCEEVARLLRFVESSERGFVR
jgi:UDP-N-acetylglucosamine acyltransferase